MITFSLTLPSVTEVLPPNTHLHTNQCSPRVVVDYTTEDLIVSTQNICYNYILTRSFLQTNNIYSRSCNELQQTDKLKKLS
jgi:hypothetical protein